MMFLGLNFMVYLPIHEVRSRVYLFSHIRPVLM
jgi:hypothetical protein